MSIDHRATTHVALGRDCSPCLSWRLYRCSPPARSTRPLAFSSYRNGSFGIYVMNADGSSQTQLTNDSAFYREPAWSPDGRQLVFHSWRNGKGGIYVMNADGSNLTRLTVGSGPLVWSPR